MQEVKFYQIDPGELTQLTVFHHPNIEGCIYIVYSIENEDDDIIECKGIRLDKKRALELIEALLNITEEMK